MILSKLIFFLYYVSCVCAFVCLLKLTPASKIMKLLLLVVDRVHKTEEISTCVLINESGKAYVR